MRRVPELDALRGIAAVVIVVFHLRFTNRYPVLGTAVDLFFVLSGYLITTIILETYQTENFLKNFYMRRALRIWPIYYLTFPIFLVVNRLLPQPHPLDGLPYYLTYTQFIQGYWFGELPRFSLIYRHTWTLAIEEQFYLFWPLLVRALGRRYLPALILPLVVLPTVMRSCGFIGHMLLTRCDGLALGALLAVLLLDRRRVDRWRPAFQAAFGLVIVLAMSYPAWAPALWRAAVAAWPGHPWHMTLPSVDTLRICVLYFGVVGTVLCTSGAPWLAVLRDGRLQYLGRISYGLYLYHPLVFTIVMLAHFRLGLRASVWIDLFKLAACLGVSAASWRFVEKPILALKDRFAYRRSSPLDRNEMALIDQARPNRRTIAQRARMKAAPVWARTRLGRVHRR
jgi:peptidoglycan/LPS O-acetylase OafA/YrhL